MRLPAGKIRRIRAHPPHRRCAAGRVSSEPVRTFSIGFEESAFNELEYAAMVAREYRTEHHEIVVRPDAVDLVSRLMRHFAEPFGDSSAIPMFIVSEFAARYVKV